MTSPSDQDTVGFSGEPPFAVVPPQTAATHEAASMHDASSSDDATHRVSDDAGAAPVSEESPTGPSLRTDSLADSVVILLTMIGLQRLIGFMRAVLFCRLMTPEELGRWEMAFGFLMLAPPLVVLALPGTFGRYLDYYWQRGQFRPLLRGTAIFCAAAAVAACLGVCLFRDEFASLVFGTPAQRADIVPLAISMIFVVGVNYLTDLFTALRNVRLVAVLQLVNSVAFAGLGAILLWGREAVSQNAILAYGGASLISMLVAWPAVRRVDRSAPLSDERIPRGELRRKLMPFAAWILAAGFLSGLFDVVDRYLILHADPAGEHAALALIGQYHSARLIPTLLASIASLLGAIMMPHLASDWEQGRRDRVSDRLNLFLKTMTLVATAVSVVVLWIAPLLFQVAFFNKFAEGEAVLAWTLAAAIWFGLVSVALNYLWCAERASLGCLALVLGLGAKVALNLALLPGFGLPGVVAGTSLANGVTLSLICVISCFAGFRMDRSTWLILAIPPILCLGSWPALACLAALAPAMFFTDFLLSPGEKRILRETLHGYAAKAQALPVLSQWFGREA